MLFCHFNKTNSKKLHSKLLKTFFCFSRGIFFNVSGTRSTVSVANLFEKAEYKKPIFQELISRVLWEIETREQVFCVALGPVTICISIGIIELLYLLYNTE